MAFRRLKRSLTTAPILSLPRDDGSYVLDTDASNSGLGVVLSQLQDGEEKVILCTSRLLSKAERNYDTTKKELLAVVYGLKQCRQYLLGRRFAVRTVHAALSWLLRTPEPMPQLARWLTFIEEFSFDVQHKVGTKHQNVDFLSRMPICDESLLDTEHRELHISTVTQQEDVDKPLAERCQAILSSMHHLWELSPRKAAPNGSSTTNRSRSAIRVAIHRLGGTTL